LADAMKRRCVLLLGWLPDRLPSLPGPGLQSPGDGEGDERAVNTSGVSVKVKEHLSGISDRARKSDRAPSHNGEFALSLQAVEYNMQVSTTAIDLRQIFDACQDAEDWVAIPGGGPSSLLMTALQDVSSSQEPPALAAFHHWYRAIYVPDARLAVAWGMPDDDWRDRNPRVDPPEWKPEGWNSVEPRYAHVLLNGSPVWQVRYGSVDWGAGISGDVPWPNPRFKERSGIEDAPEIEAWETTTWEYEFARMLNDLSGHDDFRYEAEVKQAAGMQVLDIHPLDAAREGF
jgi:hypothetical protein